MVIGELVIELLVAELAVTERSAEVQSLIERLYNLIITGLELGKYYYVRHMAIVVGEEPYWEEPIRVKVK
jgi:hypothetical protein